VNVDTVSVCLTKGLVDPHGIDILDDGDVDRGESARAVSLFGGHGCGCVNVVVLINSSFV
jgi:hypothetical protein